jgi:hypothetical protein
VKRLVILLVSAVLVAFYAAPVGAAPVESGGHSRVAEAAAKKSAKRHSVSKGYTHNWVFHPKGSKTSGLNNKCIFIEVRATMKGRWYQTYGDHSTGADRQYITWEGLRLVNPNITAIAWPEVARTGGCDSTKRLKLKGYLQQGFYAASCKLDVDVAVGAGADSGGWNVGVTASPTYKCSKDKVGWVKDTFSMVKTMGTYTSGISLTWDVANGTKETGVGFQGTWDVSGCFAKGPCDHWRKSATLSLMP